MKNHSSQDTTLDISIIGLMSALVFVGTYFFKIPSAFGYTHLGDCMIILTVCLFGTRRGVLAGATRRSLRFSRRLRGMGSPDHVIKRSLGVHRRNHRLQASAEL